MARTRCSFSVASVLGIAGLIAGQTTLHVSPAGDDRRGTGSLTAPFQSLDTALTRSATMTDAGATLARFADLDHDGDQDLLLVQGNRLGWFENIGTRTTPRFLPPRWVPGAVFPMDGAPQETYPVDFQFDVDDGDGDGRLDLFVTRSDGHLWFLRSVPGTGLAFAAPVALYLAPFVQATNGIVLLDIDGDGRRDLVLTSLLSRSDFYWMRRLGEGNPPAFGAPQFLLPCGTKAAGLTFVDVNGDRRRDLVLWSRVQPVATRVLAYFPNVGTNAVPSFSSLAAFGMIAAWVAEADLDGNGQDEFYAAILSLDRTRFDILRLPRDAAGRPEVAAGVPLRFDPTAPVPQRIAVEVPPDDFRYVTAFPLTVSGSVEVVAGLPAPGSSMPRVVLSPLGPGPGGRLLTALAPRLGLGQAMVALHGEAPRFEGFELLCHDASLDLGIESDATSPVIARVAARGFATGFLSSAGRPVLSQCAASGCITAAVLQKGGAVRSCTLAGNGNGLILGSAPGQPPAQVSESILAGNAGLDLAGFGAVQVADSFVRTVGGMVTVSATNLRRDDPGLRNPRGGDLSLAPGSPAIDAGGAVMAVDLDGSPRCVGARPDLGAYEWSPVALHLQVRDRFLGALAVDVARPAGTLMLLLAGTAAASPLHTPFGDLLLGRFWILPVQDGGTVLGDTRALAGSRILFQAFVLDPAAASGWPTNAVEWAVR